MKRIVFLMGVAVLAFASCAKDTVSETNNGRAIDFRVATETRATEVSTYADLPKFNATAISVADETEGDNYFSDVPFEGTNGTYSSANAYYWPESGSLNFYAYYPSTLTGVTITSAEKTVDVFTPAAEIKDQVDFVIGKGSGDKSNQIEGVQLTFNHMLSQIEIKAKNDDVNHVFKVAGFKISNVYSSGELDFSSTPSWTPSETSTTYGVEYKKVTTTTDESTGEATTTTVYYPIELGADAKTVSVKLGEDGLAMKDGNYVTDNAMLIPQTLPSGAKLEVLVNVTSATGVQIFPSANEEYDWMDVDITTTWVAGMKYTYVLNMTESLKDNAIKFTTEFVGWGTGTTGGAGTTEDEFTPSAN